MTSLSLKDAAQRAGVSEKTLRRKLTATPPDIESTKDERGRYQVTLAALATVYPHVLEDAVDSPAGNAGVPAAAIDPRFGTQLELDKAPVESTVETAGPDGVEVDMSTQDTADVDDDESSWTDDTNVIELEPFDENLLDIEYEDEDEDGDVDTQVEGGHETGTEDEISPTTTVPRIIEPERPSGVPSWAPHPDTVLGALRRVTRRRR